MVPPLIRSTLRCMVSPGAMALAPMFSRLVAEPVAPRVSVTVPDEIVWLCDTELVKVAYVAMPAMLAAAPSAASEYSSLRPRRRLRTGDDKGSPSGREGE